MLDISAEFSDMNYSDLRRFLRQKIKEDPFVTFSVIIDWVYKQTARKAKACLDDTKLKIDSIIIRATRKQRVA